MRRVEEGATVGMSEIVHDFAMTIVDPFDLEEFLHRLTARVRPALAAQGCGIMVKNAAGQLGFTAASSDAVVAIDEHQAVVNEGACFDAYERNEPLIVPDIESEQEGRPGYHARMVEAGFRAVRGVPMNAFRQTIGVMNLYRCDPGPWALTTLEDAQTVAAIGAGALVHAHEPRRRHEVTSNLEQRSSIAIGSARPRASSWPSSMPTRKPHSSSSAVRQNEPIVHCVRSMA